MIELVEVLALVLAFGGFVAWLVRREERAARRRRDAEALAAWLRSPAYQQFKANIEALQRALGEALMPAMRRVADALNDFAGAVGTAMNRAAEATDRGAPDSGDA